MRFAKYWAAARATARNDEDDEFAAFCWEWSNLSEEDARTKAEYRAQQVAARRARGEELRRYGYGDRPLREEITDTLTNTLGQTIGVVTRNRYGALVLNAAQALFIDLDFPTRVRGGAPKQTPLEMVQTRAQQWAQRHPELGVRFYRTHSGLRGLVTNKLFEPTESAAETLLREIESDPLYIRLCRQQASFRARLTPKPWRCEIRPPTEAYPFRDARTETVYRAWERRYDAQAAHYATCAFWQAFGPETLHPDIRPLVNYHDDVTGVTAGAGKPLA